MAAGGKAWVSAVPSWRLLLENVCVGMAYWGISHLNYLLFSGIGVLPMPIWPAAALAIVTAFYRGWRIAPGIAAGTILANHYSLGGSWGYAVAISVMNAIGPLAGAALARRRVSLDLEIRGLGDIAFCFAAMVVLTPMLTATGGIGSKWLLGLMPGSAVPAAWLKWAMAHAMGTVLFALPVFAWLAVGKGEEA